LEIEGQTWRTRVWIVDSPRPSIGRNQLKEASMFYALIGYLHAAAHQRLSGDSSS
jgi:hypothetical protein